jgi:tetratricopeptide (TPR) repeat protein
MTQRAAGLVVVLAVLTYGAYAQGNQAPQGGQTQPAPQPQPQPTNRQPGANNPQPSPGQNPVTIRGRIITGDQSLQSGITEVRIETDGGQPIGFAYANSTGEFYFQQAGLTLDQNLYVVVKIDGFKPYRERVFMGTFDGFVTIFLERETTVTVSRPGESVVDLKQLRAKVPGKAVDEYEKALKESSRGNRGKAVEGLQRAIKLAPDFYEAQHTLGIQYLALQQYEDAETALLRARDLSPKAAEPLINLGTLYYQRGEAQREAGRSEDATATFEKSADFLEESVRRNPLSPSAHGYLGATLYKMGNYERAETVLKRALDLDEGQLNARLMLVNVYTRSGRYKEALEQTNVFIAKNPKSPQRASVETIKAQIEKALAK